MNKWLITLPDVFEPVEITGYAKVESGCLVIWDCSQPIAAFAAGHWIGAHIAPEPKAD